jgi:hypothetical protein
VKTSSKEVIILVSCQISVTQKRSEKMREDGVGDLSRSFGTEGPLTVDWSSSVWLAFADVLSRIRHLHKYAGKFSGVRHSGFAAAGIMSLIRKKPIPVFVMPYAGIVALAVAVVAVGVRCLTTE